MERGPLTKNMQDLSSALKREMVALGRSEFPDIGGIQAGPG